MAEVEITLPTVQYGNVKVRATPEELGLDGVQDAGALGVAAAVYLNLFTQGYQNGSQIDVDYEAPPKETKPIDWNKVGEQGVTEEQAERMLDEGLGGVTELHEDSTEEVSDDGQNDAPWASTPPVDTGKKPWETGGTAPTNKVAVAEINW